MTTEKNNQDNWQPTTKRFVAFLDIMGFKDMVARKSHDEIYKILDSISKTREEIAKQSDFVANSVYITTFSDSIVIFSKDDSKWSYESFIMATLYLFSQTVLKTIPVKGACAFGEITVNKSGAIFFGQPLIDAYLLEEDVHYYGIVCHNSYEKYLYESKDEKIREYANFRVKTKLKSGDIIHYNLDWFDVIRLLTKNKHNENVNIEDVLNKLYLDVSGKPRAYIDNTLEMYNRWSEKKKVPQ